MWKVTKKVLKILNNKQKKRVALIVFLMLIGGLLESVSVSLILPLVQAVMNKDTWNQSGVAKVISDLFKINDQRTYVVAMLVALVTIFIVKNIYLIYE